jgi:hypothetical protein
VVVDRAQALEHALELAAEAGLAGWFMPSASHTVIAFDPSFTPRSMT